MFQGGSSFQNETYQNIPSMAMMFTMYTPTFGNGAFVVQPASSGDVQDGFPSVPYLPLEAMIYQQQASNPAAAPVNTLSGQSIGQQNIAGTQTVADSTATSRYQIGYSAGQ